MTGSSKTDSSETASLDTGVPKATSLTERIALWLATGFGFGFFPKAPGTVGALWGIPLAWAVMSIPAVAIQLIVLVALYAIGIPLCTSAARTLGKKDPGSVVWDEIVTVPLVLLFVSTDLATAPGVLLLAFLLHRIYDISKPPPVRWFEKLPDGLGIMTDDVIAAFYGCATLHVLLFAISKFATE